jgi:hypothetical protein
LAESVNQAILPALILAGKSSRLSEETKKKQGNGALPLKQSWSSERQVLFRVASGRRAKMIPR